MVGLDDHLKDPLYANWVKNTCALNIANAVLKPYVYGEVVKIHRSIISRCPDAVTCGSCSWRQAPRCPNCFCNIIKIEIKENHRHENPSFDNTNARDCKNDAWEVAKCFMPKGYRECTSSGADFSAIVNIVINCKAFDEHVWCDLDQPENIFSKARKMRNHLMHSDEQKIPECVLQSNLDLLMCILNDFKTIPPNSPEAIDELTKLKAGKLRITFDEVLEAREQLLQARCATREFVDDQIAKLRQEIQGAATFWKVPQHKLIGNFVTGCKYSLVKIMEIHIDKARPETCSHHEWNLSRFLDKLDVNLEIKSLSQLHRGLLYPDDGNTADINDWDLFLLCHILSIDSVFELDDNEITYIQEIKKTRDKILRNPDKIAEEDLEVLAKFLKEPLRTEIINIYGGEDINADAVKLESILTFWRQEEENMGNKQINTKALQKEEKNAARINDLESQVKHLYELVGHKTNIGSKPEGHDQEIETNVQLQPKHCDKKEEEQVQDNMTSENEAENIFLANGGITDFCEQLNLKTAQPSKGSIILKVTCESVKDLIRFWYSCTDGSALRALSKVRDDYRNFLGCDTLDFDIVLTRKEVKRCMDHLVDRLSSWISDISVLEKVLGSQTFVETGPVEAKDASKEKMNIVTEESDRETRITRSGAEFSEDVQQFREEATTSGGILRQTRVSLEEVHDVPEEVHDVPEEVHDVSEEVHDVPEEIHDVPGRRKELRLEEDRPGIPVETSITSFGARRMEDIKQFEVEPRRSSGILKQTPVSFEKPHDVPEEVHDVPVRSKELSTDENRPGLSRTDASRKEAKHGEEDARRLAKFLEEIAENFEEGKISVIKPYIVQMIKHSKDRDRKAFDEVIKDFTEATKFRKGISVTLITQAFRGFRKILIEPEFGDLVAAKIEAIEKQEELMGGVESKAWRVDPKNPEITAEDIQVGDKIAKERSKASDTMFGKSFEKAGTSKEFGYPGRTVTQDVSLGKLDPLKSKQTELTMMEEKTKSLEQISSIRKPGSPEATETLPKSEFSH